MGIPKYRAKRDISEPEIVRALEQIGMTVWRMDQPVDLLVGWREKTHLVECKTGKGKLNKNQLEFTNIWRGSPVVVLRDAQEAIDWAIEVSQS
ncbi:hypothetical protein [Oricola thermophila]|uniref:VRR-NUC domain-containing protein n=1 Tax=Oricola thermophila TaxID=2742145 RepID=A0A6N1VB04_9HYPH|nr:hypothetical protein [Oricola thermophila]QKV17838.1 hypothetical protein HTY61_04880 [Oricola thermophila]